MSRSGDIILVNSGIFKIKLRFELWPFGSFYLATNENREAIRMIIRKNVTSKNIAPKLVALTIAACIPFSSFAVEEEGFIEKVGNKIEQWSQGGKANKWIKSEGLNEAFDQATGSIETFNTKIADIQRKTMSLVQGDTCGSTATNAFASTARALREFSSSFGAGGSLRASVSGGITFLEHQLAVLDATDADLATKTIIVEKYTSQAKKFADHLASIDMWHVRLNELEVKVLSKQSLTIHYCVLQENDLIINEIASILNDLEQESAGIEDGISAMLNPKVVL